jgi:hypothetical protein
MDKLDERPGEQLSSSVAKRLLPGRVDLLEVTVEAGCGQQVERNIVVASDPLLERSALVNEAAEHSAHQQERRSAGEVAERSQHHVLRDIPDGYEGNREHCGSEAAQSPELDRAERDRHHRQHESGVPGVVVRYSEREDAGKEQ